MNSVSTVPPNHEGVDSTGLQVGVEAIVEEDVTAAMTASEIGSGDDYFGSQLWAEKLWQAGFGGIWYQARHDPRADLHSIALFGKPGLLSDHAIGVDVGQIHRHRHRGETGEGLHGRVSDRACARRSAGR